MENNNLTLESKFPEADESTMKDFYDEMVKRMFGSSPIKPKPYQYQFKPELPHFHAYETYMPVECLPVQGIITIKEENK